MSPILGMRLSGLAARTLLLLCALSAQAGAAELLMFERRGCPYCAQWRRVIGPIYPKTELAGAAPLHPIDLDEDPMPDVALARPVRFTPTFVLAADGREVGRIEGYPGEDFFWARLGVLVDALQRTR